MVCMEDIMALVKKTIELDQEKANRIKIQIKTGGVLQKLRSTGELDPRNPRQYNDVCIALLARQIGATVVTRDINDFKRIQSAVDFRYRDVIKEA